MPGDAFGTTLTTLVERESWRADAVLIALMVVSFVIGAAALVCSFLVVVKGWGKLRIAAVVLLTVRFLNIDVTIPISQSFATSPAGQHITRAIRLLEANTNLLQLAATLAAVLLLLVGIAEARRARAARAGHSTPMPVSRGGTHDV